MEDSTINQQTIMNALNVLQQQLDRLFNTGRRRSSRSCNTNCSRVCCNSSSSRNISSSSCNNNSSSRNNNSTPNTQRRR
ncbi:probable basic-leucine zipper transcription factor F [Osmia bicornis bicornis]|uniref:probable basic-leucine zipper transcription factor F n=1 Tax=Osmia bicornis bicornis TaxID=1437191 RepID=UPI001EAF8368|nr:probable basic-leucine zipper transcription factor F [Osmia bicornis bicornis]